MFTISALDEDVDKTTDQPLKWYPCSPIIKIALLFTPQIKEEISESFPWSERKIVIDKSKRL